MDKRYKSDMIIAIDQSQSSLNPAAGMLPFGGGLIPDKIGKEIEILRSRKIIEDLIERLNLKNDPYFSPTDLPKYTHESIKLAITLDNTWKNLDLRQLNGEPIIKISFTADTPEKPTILLNALVDLYTLKRNHHKTTTTQKTETWLNGQANKLKNEFRDIEKKILLIQENQGHINLDWQMLTTEKKRLLNQNTVKLQHEIKILENRLKNITSADSALKKLEEIPEIIQKPNVQRLKLNLAEQENIYANLTKKYGPKHPKVIDITSQLKATKNSLNSEINIALANIKKTLIDKKDALKNEQETINKLQKETLYNAQNDIKIKNLEYELSYKRTLYEEMIKALQNIKINAMQQNDIQIISPASIALKPITPSIKIITTLGTLIGFIFAFTLSTLLNTLDSSIKSTQQLEKITQTKCLGLIPSQKANSPEELSNYITSYPDSILAESIRTIHYNINLYKEKTKTSPKVISVTSSFKSEGKTATSCWLARSSAKSGQRVIIIDCDLRRPNVHKFMNYKNEVSLADYLSGKASIEDIIHTDPQTGMHMIYAAPVPSHALDLINSDKLKQLINALKQTYDLIILDTPASLAVHDPKTLAQLSDLTLYVVSWKKNNKEDVLQGIHQFTDLNIHIATIFTQVDIKRHSSYGYGSTLEYYQNPS